MDGSKPYSEIDLSMLSNTLIPVPTQNMFIDQMVQAMRFFFGKDDDSFGDLYPNLRDTNNFPFKGFIFQGPPGSGKTEAVIEAGRRLNSELGNSSDPLQMRLIHVNSSNINAKGFGDSEQRLKHVFREGKHNTNDIVKTIILFDDIDSLLTRRDDPDAKEWTRSLNGVFFHELDTMITTKTMVIATTNLPDKIDPAVRSRLAMRDAPAPTLDEMKIVAKSALPIRGARGKTQADLLELTGKSIEAALEKGEDASFRLARQTAIEIVLEHVTGWKREGF